MTTASNLNYLHANVYASVWATRDMIPDDSLKAVADELAKLLYPLYRTLIVACVWSAMLVPLLVALFLFSTKRMRRRPIFVANVLSISLGLGLAAAIIALMMSVLQHPLDPPSKSLSLAFTSLLSLSPMLVESILLIRLLAVYPYERVPLKVFLAIFIPIGLLKTARVINSITYLVYLSKDLVPGVNTLLLLQERWTRYPNYKIEWFLQVVDNTSASVLFLVQLNKGRGVASRSNAVPDDNWSGFLETLFWIAVSNFVIPVMLSIAQLVVVWVEKDIFDVVPICLVNVYVEIIGVLLATVWAAGTRWQEESEEGERTDVVLTAIGFRDGPSSTRSRLSTCDERRTAQDKTSVE
ncbi:hypothetical protein AX17_002371 [Amanita inopinata Kibby_2008]|nr:hypothetical protein AX17_002371 [Amanita inopinata Kibby_2008]